MSLEKTLVIVEDDLNTLDMITRYFEHEGLCVNGFSSIEGVLPFIRSNDVALCILDVMIGHDNGFDLLKTIKAEYSEMPIIFVTAKSDEFDRIYGIEIGGDDYLTKPFSPRELVVRAKRLLARQKAYASAQTKPADNQIIAHGTIRVQLDTMEVFDGDCLITLTLKEFEALVYFMQNPRIVLSRDRIIEQVWGYDALGQTRMVDDIVKRLRKKLSVEIETVWGVGYRYHA
ncbi:MAG: two-component system, OmpR family, response regulator CssR [Clostridiales bacterium]|jgi:two-component system response regulator CssR|nr:two-component system, OmpR family, response regulator CssR [Clostridiales bacterium]MDN5298868.1 two-component system, OmpR family, response regulator CssR [Clostridiales bacterium]